MGWPPWVMRSRRPADRKVTVRARDGSAKPGVGCVGLRPQRPGVGPLLLQSGQRRIIESGSASIASTIRRRRHAVAAQLGDALGAPLRVGDGGELVRPPDHHVHARAVTNVACWTRPSRSRWGASDTHPKRQAADASVMPGRGRGRRLRRSPSSSRAVRSSCRPAYSGRSGQPGRARSPASGCSGGPRASPTA